MDLVAFWKQKYYDLYAKCQEDNIQRVNFVIVSNSVQNKKVMFFKLKELDLGQVREKISASYFIKTIKNL